ncbi:hypothetical protein MXB_1668 [Myxobolus squamalis]|nr:hypothetical protein MXB_1668 [Myxobolus squamalis]
MSFCMLTYMSFCTYRTVLQLKFFDLIRIMNNHQTQTYSLLHSATFFFAPICLNYLSMIHLDKGSLFKLNQTVETSFSQIEGRLELLPIISKYFNVYYPMIIIIVCLLSLFRCVTRVMHNFGIGHFFLRENTSDDMVSEGSTILQREKNSRLAYQVSDEHKSNSDTCLLVSDISTNF